MKYEYLVQNYGGTVQATELEQSFNELGQEGWKLVAVTEIADKDGDSCGTTAYFIREK